MLVVLLIIIVAVGQGGSSDSGDTGSSSENANSASGDDNDGESSAGLNTPVRDGKFEFVVSNVEGGLAEVGENEFLREQAQGQFVIVSMSVKNISDEPQSFDPSSQKLKDTEGRTFEPDTTAQIALGGSDVPVWDNINPGNAVDVKVVYDMPQGAVPASIELHDSMFSGGVEVSLQQ
ncbi:DUF4352 domain-containing protein [Gordonia sp. NPDC062954]|uniref:DUF4352 domain-containing protein n=1 Tax=Gordonia sp. NPDC062954 TaxID=3364003 RepID=UPI0037C8618B